MSYKIKLHSREECFPFGENAFGGYAKKRYRFTGKERDDGSGLYYFGARYYAPWTCRFTSVDPLAMKFAHLSPYNYSENNPITYNDLYGLQAVPNKFEMQTIQGPETPQGGGLKGGQEIGPRSQGPWNSNNIFRKDNGVLVARRMTTNERRVTDASMGVVSALPLTRVTGTVIGLTYEGAKMYNDYNNTFLRDASLAGGQKLAEGFFEAASKDVLVGQNQGMMKSAKNAVGKIGVGIGLYNAFRSFSSDATANETIGLLSFSIAESGGLGNINISNEGLFEFNLADDISKDQAIETFNAIDSTLNKVLENYDLNNVADQDAAIQFVKDNMNMFKQTVSSGLQQQSNSKSDGKK